LVTRGNVAIYCYNALTAKTWDVTESTDGKLTSSSRETTTILEKYFSDFVNEAGDMKLVEGATVEVSGAVSTAVGPNQIILTVPAGTYVKNSADAGIAGFIDAKNQPNRNEEEVTYAFDYKTATKFLDVVAYVPAEVANIANLAGRKVDVIFGRDNEVAYIAVTDDSYEGMLVTAFEEDKTTLNKSEIEIDGELYEIWENAPVLVFGHKVGTGAAGIKDVVAPYINAKNETTRNIVAEFTLNGKDEIESINFKMSINGFTKTDATTSKSFIINEFVVEKISAKNVITKVGNSFKNDLDDYEDLEPRVIKNGKVAEVADIQVGDVVTEVVYDDAKVEVMIVTSNSVEGALTDYASRTNVFDIDGTEYKVIVAPFYNVDGEIDEYLSKDADKLMDDFEDEEITAYLNFAGEVVAVVGESEATGAILGIVTEVENTTDEDNDEVEYLKIRILAENGTDKTYKIYNKKSGKDVSDATEYDDIKLLAGMNSSSVEAIEKAEAVLKVAKKLNKVAVVTEDTATTANKEAYENAHYAATVVAGKDTISASVTAKTTITAGTTTKADANTAITKLNTEIDALVAEAEKDLADVQEAAVIGSVVRFTANEDRIIKSDDIEIIDLENSSKELDFKAASKVTVKKLTLANLTADVDNGKIIDNMGDSDDDTNTTYRYSSSTITLNPATNETISWNVLAGKEVAGNDNLANTTASNLYVFVDGSKVIYAIASIAELNYCASEEQYGILVDTRRAKDEDDNTIYMATVLVDGAEVEYECDSDFRNDFNEGDFIKFKVSDGEIVTSNDSTLVQLEISKFLSDLTDDDMTGVDDYTSLDKGATSLKAITVDSVEDNDGKTYLVFEDKSTVDLADGYIVYDLEAGEETDTIAEGDYVLVTDLDDEEGYQIVIVL